MTLYARQISQTCIRTFTQPTSFIIINIQTNVHLLFAVYDTTFFLLFCLCSAPFASTSVLSHPITFRAHFSFFLQKRALSLTLHIYTSYNFLLSFVSFSGFPFGPFLSSFLFFWTNGQQLDNYMPIIGSYLYSFLCLGYVYFRCSSTLMYLIKK